MAHEQDQYLEHLGALVLCGGQSQRMGRPKAWLSFGPEVMLQRVVRLIGTVARKVIVVAASDQQLPALPQEVLIVRDTVAGRGPLQGLATGMRALPETVDLVYVTATDAPFSEPQWIIRLIHLIGANDLAMPLVGGRYHPLAALYRRSTVLPAIEEMLRADRLRPVSLIEAVNTRIVQEVELRDIDPKLQTVRNLNVPEDYEKALMDAGFNDEGSERSLAESSGSTV